MRNERQWWKTAAVLGVAAIALACAGCHDRGSGVVEDAVEIPEVAAENPGDGSEALPVADPAPAAEEQTSVDDGHDAIAQKIDELFARLVAETKENEELLATILELQEQVEKLQERLNAVEGRKVLPTRPPSDEGVERSAGRPRAGSAARPARPSGGAAPASDLERTNRLGQNLANPTTPPPPTPRSL